MTKQNEKEIPEQKSKSEDSLSKIAITKEADRALVTILERIGEGFDSGRATKQDVASHIIMHYSKNCTDKEIHAIRSLFFDPILAMEAKLKKAKETGVLPESLRNLLLEEFMISTSQVNTKRHKKSLNENIIIDNVLPSKEIA